jgi:hypothetical protein
LCQAETAKDRKIAQLEAATLAGSEARLRSDTRCIRPLAANYSWRLELTLRGIR